MLGTVAALRRYPVKSMLGEDVDAVDVAFTGLAGDRRMAVISRTTGKVASAKLPRLWRDLLTLSAASDAAAGAVRIRLPEGRTVRSSDADIDAILSDLLDEPVTLTATPPPGAALDRAVPEAVLRDGVDAPVPAELMEIGGGGPPGTFVDFAPLHLLSTSTLGRIAELSPHTRADLERYRPNIVVRTTTAGFTENGWLGRNLRIGDDLVLRVIARTPRCAVPTLAHGALPRDPEALRVLARHNRIEPFDDFGPEPCAGVYAEVLRPGRIGIGDPVRLALPPGAEAAVQVVNLLVEAGYRALDDETRSNLADGQRYHRGRRQAELGQPGDQLLGRAHVDDAAEPDPGVRGRAHRAVLARGEHGGGGPLPGAHVRRRPAGQLEFRVPGRVAQAVLAVAVLGQDAAVSRDEHRAEREVPRVDRLGRQFHAAAQVRQVLWGGSRRAGVGMTRYCHRCSVRSKKGLRRQVPDLLLGDAELDARLETRHLADRDGEFSLPPRMPFEQDAEYLPAVRVDAQPVELPDVTVGRVNVITPGLLGLGFRDQRDGFHLPDLRDRPAVRDRAAG
jgi:uncharacterized protein